MSWSIEEHIGEGRPWPAQIVVYRGETDECLAYVSGEMADRLQSENAKLRELAHLEHECNVYSSLCEYCPHNGIDHEHEDFCCGVLRDIERLRGELGMHE